MKNKTSKRKKMANLKFKILTVAIVFFATGLKAQQINFSGKWSRNTDKCEVGEGLSINSIPIELIIKQSNSQIEITRSSKNAQGESSIYTENPNFNGSLSIAVVKPNMNKKGKIEWSANHREVTLIADYTDDQGTPLQKIKETWALSDDGKSLVIKAVLSANGQEYPMVEAFDRK